MLRFIAAMALFGLLFAPAPALAVDAKQKKETCEFGANDQKLAGAARKKFMSKCMANEDAQAAKPKKKAQQQPQTQMPPPPQ